MNEPPVPLDNDTALHQAASPADGLGDLRAGENGVFWLSADPTNGSRRLWYWHNGHAKALTPPELDVASRVNGYGGGAHACLGDTVVFVASDHQMLYRQALAGGDVQPWWSQPDTRYGGLVADPTHQRLLAVEETGSARDATQCLVALSDTGRTLLVEGADFYGAPTLAPDGRRLAWVEWSLPNMPWQRSQLCVADLDTAGHIERLHVWDGGGAVTQPCFTADGSLIVLSDHRGWWQPYRLTGDDALAIGDACIDHVSTPWQIGECHHLWPGSDGVLMRFQEGAATLWQVDGQGQARRQLLPDATRIIGLATAEDWLYAITQGPSHAARLVRVHLGDGHQETLFALPTPDAPPVSTLISAAVSDNEHVTAFVYLPELDDTGILPPLIMRVHGGPTAASYPVFDPLIRWWTQQGYAVADLNPRGSGNFGRVFRECLAGQWGRLDVDDAIAMADELVNRRVVDPRRLFLRGQSAGGFTVLNTLASTRCFRAGASLYGVTDAVRLATQTHRFESGYLDWLLGDDQAKHDASPVNRLDTFAAPVIFFQGGRDSVVLPDQTLSMATALRRQGVEAEIVLFPEEGHGIRHPANRRRLIARELAFFAAHGGEEP